MVNLESKLMSMGYKRAQNYKCYIKWAAHGMKFTTIGVRRAVAGLFMK